MSTRNYPTNVTLPDEVVHMLAMRYPMLNRSARIREAATRGVERYKNGIGQYVYIPHGVGVKTYTFHSKPAIDNCVEEMATHLSKARKVAILVILGLDMEDKYTTGGGQEL